MLSLKSADSDEFVARSVFVSFIYSVSIDYLGIKRRTATNPCEHGLLKSEFRKYRKATFAPELNWKDECYYISLDILVNALCVNGKYLKVQLSELFLIAHPGNTGSIIGIVEFDSNCGQLSYQQCINLCRLVRTQDKIQDSFIQIIFKQGILIFDNVRDIVNFAQVKHSLYFSNKHRESLSDGFIYTYLHIGHIDAVDGTEVGKKYSFEINGLINNWDVDLKFQKPSEAANAFDDIHPFEYGYTVVGSTFMLSLHPPNVQDISKLENLSVRQHNTQEVLYGLVLLEIGISRYATFRRCVEVVKQSLQHPISIFDYFLFLPIFIQASSALETERFVVTTLNEISLRRLMRKEYSRNMVTLIEKRLGVSEIEADLRRNVDSIGRVNVGIFQSLIALASFVVGFCALIVALFGTK